MPITFDDIRGKAAAAHGAKLKTAPEKLGPPAPGHDVAGPFSSRLKAIANPLDTGPPVKPIHGTPSKNVINIRTPHAVHVVGDELQGALTRNVATGNSLVAHPVRTLTGHNAQSIERLHVKNGKVVSSGTPAQQRAAMGLLIPAKGVLGSAQEMMGIGPGLGLLAIQGVHDPLGTVGSVAHGIGSSMAGTFTHGRYGSKANTPLDDAMNMWTALSLGAGGLGRAGEMASADSAKGLLKAAAFRKPQAPRGLHVGEGEFSKTIPAASSRNAAAALVQRQLDRYTEHSVNTGQFDLGSRFLRRQHEVRAARIGRADLRTESDLANGPQLELSHYGQGVPSRLVKGKLGGKGLTMPQDHAAYLHARGVTPAEFAAMSEDRLANAEHWSKIEGVPADVIRKNHEDMLAKTKLSAQYFDEHGNLNHPKVKAAAEAMLRAINGREDMRGMSNEDIQHSLGSNWYAITHRGTGDSFHQRIASLQESAGAIPRDGEQETLEAKLRANQHEQAIPAYTGEQVAHMKAELADNVAKQAEPYNRVHLNILRRRESELRTELDNSHLPVEVRVRQLRAQESAIKDRLEQLDAHDRLAAFHEHFRAKGEELQAKGAHYLPQMSDAKPLRTRVRQAVARQRGAYDFGAPKEEKTHAHMGHLYNTGDFRTNAVPLAQHAFGKEAHLQSQKLLHETMLSLSKKTPEEVGHKAPVAIRTAGPPSDALKRYFNSIHPGDITEEEQKNAAELWGHYFPGFKPGQVPAGENVRWLHPGVADVFAPHTAGKVARGFNHFNQLVRAQRFANPKYATWFAQNAMVGLADQGAFMPANMVRYFKVIKSLDPETYSKIESTVSPGMSSSLTAPGDLKVVHGMAKFWHHVNDHMFRMTQFVHDARAMGYKSKEDLTRLMNAKDAKTSADRTQLIQRTNRNAIDYGATTPLERATIQRYMAYWPWTRAASAWTLRTLRDHPVLGEVALDAGRKGKKFVDSFYAKHGGMVPPNLEGSYPSHAGPIDMEALNTGSTLGQALEAGSGVFTPGGMKYLDGFGLGQAAPAVKTIHELWTGLNSYGSPPKSGNVFGQTLHDFGKGILPLQVAKSLVGHGPAKTGLQPTGLSAEVKKWLGDPVESGVNYDSLAQYGASIDRGSLRGVAQAQAQTTQSLRQVAQLASKVKLDPGERQAYVTYFKNQGMLMNSIASAAQKANAVGDKTKSTDQSLSFKDPVAYVMAYATTAAKVTGDKTVVGDVKQIVSQVNSDKTLTSQQKGNLLYKVAHKIWVKVNPPHVSSVYYQRLAQAGIG